MGVKRFNIDELLKPYKKGGTKNSPVTRTLGTITSKLMIGYNIPPDVVGVAIYRVFYQMAYKGLEFKGDGAYGSEGAELFSCIKAQCIDIAEKNSVDRVIRQITTTLSCTRECRYRTQKLEKQSKWTRFKNFWNEPRESYSCCVFWIIFWVSMGILIWRYIAELIPYQ